MCRLCIGTMLTWCLAPAAACWRDARTDKDRLLADAQREVKALQHEAAAGAKAHKALQAQVTAVLRCGFAARPHILCHMHAGACLATWRWPPSMTVTLPCGCPSGRRLQVERLKRAAEASREELVAHEAAEKERERDEAKAVAGK